MRKISYVLKKIFVGIVTIGLIGVCFTFFPILLSVHEGNILPMVYAFFTFPFAGYFTIQGLNNILYNGKLNPSHDITPQYLKLSVINSIVQSIAFSILTIVFLVCGIIDIDPERKIVQIVCSVISLIMTVIFIVLSRKNSYKRQEMIYYSKNKNNAE